MDRLPEWLFEGQLAVYATLGAALIVLIVIRQRMPRTVYLIAFVVVAALTGLYGLLDALVETDREQITHVFQQMAAPREPPAERSQVPFEEIDYDRIFMHVSDRYNRHGVDKPVLRSIAGAMQDCRQVSVRGFEYAPGYKQKESPSDERETIAQVRFMVQFATGRGMRQFVYVIKAVMHRDADGEWRLQNWEAFDPVHDLEVSVKVTGLP
jgi:hypothetical protein